MVSELFDGALALGQAHFERGDWQAASSAWDEGRRTTAGDERNVLEALSLWSSAASHHAHGRAEEAHRVLLEALEVLSRARREQLGLDLDGFHDALVASLEALKHRWTARSHRWPPKVSEEVGVGLELRTRCPYCGEPVLVVVAAEDASAARYVESCPVCCRPWDVSVDRGTVTIGRDDGPSS
jgi:formate dehydrogenase maturation protein FdhE